MQVSEVTDLAHWFSFNIKGVKSRYAELVKVLQHNAQQPNQQPVMDPLKNLTKELGLMPTEELSALQMRVLEKLEVHHLIGRQGRRWVSKTVRSTGFDPATRYSTIEQAQQALIGAENQLDSFKDAANSIGFEGETLSGSPSPYVINVIFQKDALIKNVPEWKKASEDWLLIVRGITGLVDERPEDVKIIGASNGSLIFSLGASAAFTKVLAIISKHIASITNDYLDFQLKREQLSRSRMMTDVMRDELSRLESERKEQGKAAIIEEIRDLMPDAKESAITSIEKGIDRQIAFSEKGGEVDFVNPDHGEEEDEEVNETIEEVRAIIEEYRAEVQQTKLLTMKKDDDEDDDDV